MAKDQPTSQQNSEEDVRKEAAAAAAEEDSGSKPELGNIDEGYQTPTSEEHKIPKVNWSCPPPAPKRKRVFVNKKNLQELGLFENTIRVIDEELEAFFKSFAEESRVPLAEPGPGPSTTAKRRRFDK